MTEFINKAVYFSMLKLHKDTMLKDIIDSFLFKSGSFIIFMKRTRTNYPDFPTRTASNQNIRRFYKSTKSYDF